MDRQTIIVMGVSGCGKTSVALGLVKHLNGTYVEADDLHPAENVAAMRDGIPLTDKMRMPWLRKVAATIDEGHKTKPDHAMVAACSALKRSYRDVIRGTLPEAIFLHLTGDYDLIRTRMSAREGHYMPVSLLVSQLATLEPLQDDETHVLVDVAGSKEEVLTRALQGIDALLKSKNAVP